MFGSINAGSNDTVATVKNLKIQVESSNNLNCALAMYAGSKGVVRVENVSFQGKMYDTFLLFLYGGFTNLELVNCRIESGSIISGNELVGGMLALAKAVGRLLRSRP